jgi:hypothetical protein
MRDQIFISYSHKDARHLEEIQLFLTPFERQYRIIRWDERQMQPGVVWAEAIREALGDTSRNGAPRTLRRIQFT